MSYDEVLSVVKEVIAFTVPQRVTVGFLLAVAVLITVKVMRALQQDKEEALDARQKALEASEAQSKKALHDRADEAKSLLRQTASVAGLSRLRSSEYEQFYLYLVHYAESLVEYVAGAQGSPPPVESVLPPGFSRANA